MNLKNTVLSLLDIFRLSKGQKIVKEEPAVPLVPLLQRLSLPAIPNGLCLADKAEFVMDVIHQNIAEKKLPDQKISKRVLGKISKHYGADLRGYGLFRTIPEKPSMLEFKLLHVGA